MTGFQAERDEQDAVDVAVLPLRSGDNVLVTMHDESSPEEARAMIDTLRERFPGVTFTVVSGVSGIAYQ